MRSMAIFTWTRPDMGARRLDDTKPKRRGARMLRYFLFAPFRFGWWMSSRVERSAGILFTLLIGAALLGVGFFLCSTFIGMIVGIPMMIAGGFLALRALY